MKKLLVIVLVSLMVQTGGFAQEELKFGHIDFQQLLSEMPSRKEAEKKYQKTAKTIQQELETMQVEYNNKYQNFMDQRDTLDDFVVKTRMQEIQNLQKRIQKYQQSAQKQLRKKEQELMQPVIKKAENAIKEVGDEKGYIYIFNTSSLMYYSQTKSDNVMPEVKKKLGIAE